MKYLGGVNKIMDLVCLCALLSQKIYQELDQFEACLVEKFSSAEMLVDGVDGCEYACVAERSRTTIVFRGTQFNCANDVMANLDLDLERDVLLGDVYVHAGFMNKLDAVWEDLYNFVLKYTKPHFHHVVVTGHSLGGALALLCAVRLASMIDLLQVQCISFGAPMVGGSSWSTHFARCHKYNLTHERFVNQNDIVPKLKILCFLGYRHVGDQRYFDADGQLHLRPLSRWERFRDWLRGHWDAVKSGQWGDSLRDHYISAYLQRLENLKNLER